MFKSGLDWAILSSSHFAVFQSQFLGQNSPPSTHSSQRSLAQDL